MRSLPQVSASSVGRSARRTRRPRKPPARWHAPARTNALAPAHLALECGGRALGVGRRLAACRLADQHLAVGEQRHDARKDLAAQADALAGRDDHRPAAAELHVPRSMPMMVMKWISRIRRIAGCPVAEQRCCPSIRPVCARFGWSASARSINRRAGPLGDRFGDRSARSVSASPASTRRALAPPSRHRCWMVSARRSTPASPHAPRRRARRHGSGSAARNGRAPAPGPAVPR